MNLDPAKIAGPMETAFQDVVGQSFLLGVSYIIFSETENRLHALHLWLFCNIIPTKITLVMVMYLYLIILNSKM